MNNTDVLDRAMDEAKAYFKSLYNSGRMLLNESMSMHSSFKVGGNTEIMLLPETREELVASLVYLKESGIDYLVLGNGSNIVVSDNGYRGVIIKLSKNFSGIEIIGERLSAQAGALLSSIANMAAKFSLTGLEFAAGIPGTIGGAVAMNAGAYDGEIKDIVEWVECVDRQGQVFKLASHELDFEYRRSRIQSDGLIAMRIMMQLKVGNTQDILDKMEEFSQKRKDKQPLNFPSAGSTFKRPVGYFAGKLIQDSGLSGYCIGGAQVSEKHCGFVINKGDATAEDIVQLIRHIQRTVKEKFGVELETEVKLIGF